MLKFFFELGEMDNIEKNLLAEAANRLDVGEYQVFQLSYEAWFGSEPGEKQLERIFFDYLMNDKVPPWARHYARGIIDKYDEGELDYNSPHYHRFDVRSMQYVSKKAGVLKIAVVALIVVGFLGASIVMIQERGKEEFPCHFPPCIRVDHNLP
jgi:hypothetical protein